MKEVVENMLIAANWSMDRRELEIFKDNLCKYLEENAPDVLVRMCND